MALENDGERVGERGRDDDETDEHSCRGECPFLRREDSDVEEEDGDFGEAD